ncbi:MAG: hypothetical protein IKO91_06790 [Oscillospiraceae bacterium]|nr:hypothetical protein [Oscillospiraceae bacterium]
MNRKRLLLILAALMCLCLLAGCAKTSAPAPTEVPATTQAPAPAPTEIPAPTEAPAPTEESPAPTEAPDSGTEAPPKDASQSLPKTPDWLALPEGAEWLSDRELAEWGAWFSMDFLRAQFLYSTYHSPEDVDIAQTFYNRGTRDLVVDMTDVRAFLLEYGMWNSFVDVLKLSSEEIDEALKDYVGLTLAETSGVGMYMLSYVPETDCYYMFRGDTNRMPDPIFLYGWKDGDQVALFYEGFAYGHGRNLSGVFRVVLEQTPGDWRFRSNEMCDTGGRWVSYVAEPDDWFPEQVETPVELSVPEPDAALSTGDMTSAKENVRAILEAETVQDAAEDYVFGIDSYDCLWGKEGDATAVFFVGADGTVIRLPVREDIEPDSIWVDMSSLLLQYTWSQEEETGGHSVNSTFLIPTGELFVSDIHW